LRVIILICQHHPCRADEKKHIKQKEREKHINLEFVIPDIKYNEQEKSNHLGMKQRVARVNQYVNNEKAGKKS
jgi:hypothetical protein